MSFSIERIVFSRAHLVCSIGNFASEGFSANLEAKGAGASCLLRKAKVAGSSFVGTSTARAWFKQAKDVVLVRHQDVAPLNLPGQLGVQLEWQ